MPVFSLKEAKTLQVKNIAQNTFQYWPESATYGYTVAGTATGYASIIERLDFSNEIITLPGKNLPSVRGRSGGMVNDTFYAYIGAGQDPVGFNSNIFRLDFSTEIVSSPGNNLTSAKRLVANFSKVSYGYFGGGYLAPGGTDSKINRLDFSSTTISTPTNNYPGGRYSDAVVNNNNIYAYNYGSSSNTILRYDFTSETSSLPGKNMPTISGGSGGIAARSFTKMYGYFVGGGNPSFLPIVVSTVRRIDFSSETISLPGQNLPGARRDSSSMQNYNYGYFGGGYGPGFRSTVFRLDFSTESFNTPGNNLPFAREDAVGTQGGQSVNRDSKTYGYFVGGAPPSGYINTVLRLDFSNEIVTPPGKNLPIGISNVATAANNYYGYLAGGYQTSVTPNYRCTIVRLDFSNESISLPGKDLPAQINIYRAGTSSGSYGYFGGGYVTPLPYYFSQITRLDFSNETVSDPGKNLPASRSTQTATSSSSYAYFAGGYENGVFVNTMTRLDFSNETVSNPGKNFPGTRNSMGVVSNNYYGYFGGNASSESTVERLDFSSETLSFPGKNLPLTATYFSGVSNNFYGYFGGGRRIFPSVYYNTITRIDFSNEVVSAPGNNLLLSLGAQNVSTVSNSN